MYRKYTGVRDDDSTAPAARPLGAHGPGDHREGLLWRARPWPRAVKSFCRRPVYVSIQITREYTGRLENFCLTRYKISTAYHCILIAHHCIARSRALARSKALAAYLNIRIDLITHPNCDFTVDPSSFNDVAARGWSHLVLAVESFRRRLVYSV